MPGIYSGRSRSPADQIATANQQLDRLATGEIENFRRRRPPPSPESQGTCVPIDEWYVRLGCGWRWELLSALLMVGANQSPVACGWSGPESTRTGASPVDDIITSRSVQVIWRTTSATDRGDRHDSSCTADSASTRAQRPAGSSARSRRQAPRDSCRRCRSSGTGRGRVYAFASVDYPGAAISQVYDSDGTTTVGAFDFDKKYAQTTAFTFSGGVYQILAVPNSTASIATGINAAGLLIGAYANLAGNIHGFALSGGSFSDVDFPGATRSLAIGVNDVGQIVGSFTDAAGVDRGFVTNGSGAFRVIDFPGATSTEATGINTAGDIVEPGPTPPDRMASCSRATCSVPSPSR